MGGNFPWMSSMYILSYKFALLVTFSLYFILSVRFSDSIILFSDFSMGQSYPTLYAEDLKALGLDDDLQKVATLSETVKEKDFEETKKLWDGAFSQPYEKAGGEVVLALEGVMSVKSPVYWEESDTDVNTKYRSMLPRFLLEVNFML